MLGSEPFIEAARRTLQTLGKTRSVLGQIPDLFNPDTGKPEYGFSGATDSSAWYIIGLLSAFHDSESKELLRGPLEAAVAAYKWLRFQDANNVWLIDSPQGADWMDAAIRRTGKTLYNNILFLMAVRSINRLCSEAGTRLPKGFALDEERLEQRFSDIFHPTEESHERVVEYWPYLAQRLTAEHLRLPYYAHYVIFSRYDLRFDTFSNLLCVLAGVSDRGLSESIISTIDRRRITSPHLVRVLDPPYNEGEEGFDVEFNRSVPVQHRSDPFNYHNGGVWPFVGGFYVIAKMREGRSNAKHQLRRLAEANSVFKQGEDTGFNEWLNGVSGDPLGQVGQSWNAGTFVAAYLSARGKDPFDFLNHR